MRSRWHLALLLVLLMLVPSVSAAWHQDGGDAGRTGTTERLDDPLDVVAHGDLYDEDVRLRIREAAGPVVTDARLYVVGDGVPCTLHQAPLAPILASVGKTDQPAGPQTVSLEIEDCATGALHAYGSTDDLLLVCGASHDDTPVLHGVEASTGRVVWGVRPIADLGITGTEVRNLPVICNGGVLDPVRGVYYVAVSEFNQGQAHRIAAVDAGSGDVLWSRPIPQNELDPTLSIVNMGTLVDDNSEPVGFTPWSLTLFGDNVLVLGTARCACGTASQTALAAWMNVEDGRLVGTVHGTQDSAQDLRVASPVHGDMAAARGDAVAFVLGDSAYMLDAGDPQPSWTRPMDAFPETGSGRPAAATWNAQALVLATATTLDIHRLGGESPTASWKADPRQEIVDTVLAEDGTMLVLTHAVQGDDPSQFVRVRIKDGAVLQRLPYPAETPFTRLGSGDGGWSARMIPMDDGQVLVVDARGHYTLLAARDAPASERPSVSTLYPGPDERVRLALGASGQMHHVMWGDGAEESIPAGEDGHHRYLEPGVFKILATSVSAAGTTATYTYVVHPGGTELNTMQTIFAPENADVTWGVIGVLIAVFGGLMAFARSRLRKNLLESKLAYLEKLKAQAAHDVPGAIEGIEAYRMQVRDALKRGRLDDIQYSVLDGEIQKILRALRTRLLAPYEGRMTKRYQRLLSSALEDGILSEKEADVLLHGLERERKLRDDEKDLLAGFLMTWAMRQVPRGTTA